MSKLITIFLALAILGVGQAAASEKSFINKITSDLGLEKPKKRDLKDQTVKAKAAFFFTVLANTQELRIHQMGGETTNQVFIRDEGQEAVFKFEHDDEGNIIDGTGKLVTDCLNKGSFNYYHPYRKPLGHFAADILPWMVWGNCREDPSTLNQRIEAYILDFKEGHTLALKRGEGYYLPEGFKFKGTGQSETIAFFSKALELANFNFDNYFPANFNDSEKQKAFFEALERGIKELLKNA